MLLNGYICRLRAASTCKLQSATPPPPLYCNISYRVILDRFIPWPYTVIVDRIISLSDPWQLNREQTAPNDTASGRLLQGVKRHPQVLRLVRCAPKETNEPTSLTEQMNSFAQSIAAVIAAGCFGVAVVQTALTTPLQVQHSGTQSYVRVVR